MREYNSSLLQAPPCAFGLVANINWIKKRDLGPVTPDLGDKKPDTVEKKPDTDDKKFRHRKQKDLLR